MAKNSREGNQSRNKRYREALAERGIRPIQVLAPESAHPLIRKAAGLMSRKYAPLDPRSALRLAGGANEPEPDEASPDLVAELAAAKARVAEVERQAEARQAEIEAVERQRQALEAERDAAIALEAVERSKVREAVQEAEEAREQATGALRQAEKAEATLQRARSLPGIKWSLVRWLAGNVLK